MKISYDIKLALYGQVFNVTVNELTTAQQKDIREKAEHYVKMANETNAITEKILLKREKYALLKSSDMKIQALQTIEEIEKLEEQLRNPNYDVKKAKEDLEKLALQKIKNVIGGEDGEKLIELAETYGKQDEIFEEIVKEIQKEKGKKYQDS